MANASAPNGMWGMLRQPIIILILTGGAGLVGWKYASEIRIMNLETSLAAHSNREAHHDAAGRLIRLETQFSYIHDELAEIRKILEDGER